jgi:hypothetical protein
MIDDWILPGENVFKSNNLGQSADEDFEGGDDSFSTKAIQDLRKSRE